MSTILKALRKLEEEEGEAAPAPALEGPVIRGPEPGAEPAAPPRRPRTSRRAPWPWLAAAGVAALGAAWLTFAPSSQTATAPPPASSAAADPVPQQGAPIAGAGLPEGDEAPVGFIGGPGADAPATEPAPTASAENTAADESSAAAMNTAGREVTVPGNAEVAIDDGDEQPIGFETGAAENDVAAAPASRSAAPAPAPARAEPAVAPSVPAAAGSAPANVEASSPKGSPTANLAAPPGAMGSVSVTSADAPPTPAPTPTARGASPASPQAPPRASAPTPTRASGAATSASDDGSTTAPKAPEPEPEAPAPRDPPPSRPAPTATVATETSAPPPAAPARPAEPSFAVVTLAPEVTVDRTKWHPDAARRTATIRLGGRARAIEVKQGQRIGELTVNEIKPSSVVFLFEGEKLDRKVGR